MAERANSGDEQALARSTKLAVQAAGGLEICERETGISDTHLSRCCSPIHRDSITIRDAVVVDSLGHGHPGHPLILNAMARQLGAVVILLPEPRVDGSGLQLTVLELSSELGDVAAAVRDAVCSSSEGGARITPREIEAIVDHLHDLDRTSAKLRHQLERLGKGDSSGPE